MFITFIKSSMKFNLIDRDLIFVLVFLKAFDCENHVRVLLRRKSKYNDVFVCSTNAFSPKIYYFNVRNSFEDIFYLVKYF
jgi:hypothetical protein